MEQTFSHSLLTLGFVLFTKAHDTNLVLGAIAVHGLAGFGLGRLCGVSLCVPGLKMADNKMMRQEFPPTHSKQQKGCVCVCTRALWLVSVHVYDSARMPLERKGEVSSCPVTRAAVQGGG